MKKILSLILVLVLCASMMTLTVSAAETGSVVVAANKATVQPGETVTVNVELQSNPGMAYLKLTPSYNAPLTLSSMTGSGLAWTIGQSAVFYATTNTTYTGSILTLTFTVAADANEGTYPINFSYQSWDENEEAVAFNVGSASVTVEKPACDHVWGTYTQTAAPSCGVAGSEVATCTKGCGTTDTKVIPALQHNFVTYTQTKAPSCGVAGEETATCENGCGTTDTKAISALQHNFVTYTQTKAPSCGVAGEETATCENGCGTTDTKVIPALQHKYENWKYTDEKLHLGTCECGETQSAEHNWEWIVDKKATATETGLKHEECSECGAKRSEGTVIPKVQGLDKVPQTGDITTELTLVTTAVVVMVCAAAAFVFKRKVR